MLPLLATLRPEALDWTAPRSPSADLVAVAADTLRAWEEMGGTTAPGLPIAEVGAVDTTLRWIVRIGAEDVATNADRLSDPAFLTRCLATSRWVPDVAREGERLRLTRYLVYSVTGSASSTGLFQFPLWALPHDEAGLDPAVAEAKRADLDRYRYTRQDVASGVYREGGAAAGHADPLVWLTHGDHEQALLQGTVAVTQGADTKLYNVHRNNGIPYDKAERDTTKQRGYWYFRAIDAVRGWAVEPVRGPALRAGVAVAGDLEHIGFGRLLALKSADGLRLVVVADTGGAFVNNLHQLDLFTGVHPSAAAFTAATGSIGDTAAAWALQPRAGDPGC
ncbi:hypothetical protein LBMAG42_44560 [Deltaproteobacteria bacterium]|nr:hypothetical protein LBMAG42_44560 [Deltaproteobacteria bacterium]